MGRAKLLLAAFTVLVVNTSLCRAQEWKTGTLLSYSTNQETRFDQGTSKPAGITCTLQVDVGDRSYFVSHHVGFIWEHLPQLTENAPIRWREEKGNFVYLDDVGRKFKAYVTKTRMKADMLMPSDPDAVKRESTMSLATDQFAGVVNNQSVELSAAFGIIIQESEGTLSGCMSVKRPLFGSGPLKGHADGPYVVFVVRSAVGKITFSGTRREDSITGTYTVEHMVGNNQGGTFTLQKVNPQGTAPGFNPEKCPTDAGIN